jgi:hypothetical protein
MKKLRFFQDDSARLHATEYSVGPPFDEICIAVQFHC